MELLTEISGRPASAYTDAKKGATTVTAWCERRSEWSAAKQRRLRDGLARLRECGVNVGGGRIATRTVWRENWAESWKRHFKPIAIGRALLIKPSWSKLKPRPGQAEVILDPGLSFGTGQHATTRFCLEQIATARRAETSQSFLDIGTGSGILAISAAKLGYAPVEAFDFDPDAVRVAHENAAQNGVEEFIRLRRADLTKLPSKPAEKFDVVCANLIYDLLLAERERILSRLKRNGRLVLAGILRKQFAPVKLAYCAEGLRLVASRAEGEWQSAAFEPSRAEPVKSG